MKYSKLISLTLAISFASLQAQTGKQAIQTEAKNEKGNPILVALTAKNDYQKGQYQQLFQETMRANADMSFTLLSAETDALGQLHEKYQVYYKGVKVEFLAYSIHSKAGKVQTISGEGIEIPTLTVRPAIQKQQAFDLAVKHTGASTYLWENSAEAALFNYSKPQGELVLLPQDNEKTNTTELKLAYKFDIYATAPLSRGDLYIDAKTGEILFYNATIKHLGEFSNGKGRAVSTAAVAANADTRYSGSQTIQTTLSGTSYILADATRGLGINTFNLNHGTSYTAAVNFTDADNNWTAAEYANTNKDNGALDAHWGAEKTYDYWSTVHNRNSYNNAGAQIKSYVHYSSAYDNAFWNGSVMTYGDGSGTYFDILTSIDVAAHEIGHAVCTNTANLAYQKESGAMNEAFSDIWGACVEYFAAPNKNMWLIGEDIERRAGHLSLRSMSNPNTELQPDTYGGTYWKTVSCTPTSTNDYCGVHTNSGVLNHWFYILAIGKSGTNDIGNAFAVTGIGVDNAAKIAYRLESVYLTANSTFANARTFGIQAALDIFGANSPEVIATTNAFYAVGVGAAYAGPADAIAPSAITDLAASGTSFTSTNLAWTASTDNVAVTGYDVYQGTTLKATVTTTTYAVTGLTPGTAYSFSVKAKDAAGNLSLASNVVDVTTLSDTTVPTTVVLSASGTTAASTNLSWTAATDNVGVTGYEVYQGATLKATVTTLTYAVTGLTAGTAYSFSVKAKDAAGNTSTSNTVSVTTSTVAYCTSQGTSAANDRISKVVLGTINNTSTATTGYENFTAISTNLVRGVANAFTITPFRSATNRKEAYRIWIDYNNDGDFLDTGEQVYNRTAISATSVSSTFTVPTTTALGPKRMRISMKYNASPTSCEVFANGQVEDYTVNITLTAAGFADFSATATAATAVLFPNPVQEVLTVRFDSAHLAKSYSIFNELGQLVQAGQFEEGQLSVAQLRAGMYMIQIETDSAEMITKKFIKQ
ncbi:MAG: hypothetical protein RL699_1868 [Bacteroidota bacterium]|jgi:Zn-dependent metalloprotease/chitodextrinase